MMIFITPPISNSVSSGSALSGPSKGVRGPVCSFLSAPDLSASASLTHPAQQIHLHQPAQHGHEVYLL